MNQEQQTLFPSIHMESTDGIENLITGSVSDNPITQIPRNDPISVSENDSDEDSSGSESDSDEDSSGSENDNDEDSDMESDINPDSSDSDCDSITSEIDYEHYQIFCNGLIRLDEENALYKLTKQMFISGMKNDGNTGWGVRAVVMAIHKFPYTSATALARFQSFVCHARAMKNKRGRNANLAYAWYATSKGGTDKILSHGFGGAENNGCFGHGVYLSPAGFPLLSVKSLKVDDDGLKHLVFCSVVLGTMEVVHSGSTQSHPSSEEFDYGVDNLSYPKRYTVWSSHMNTHILPLSVISFKAPPCLIDPLMIPSPNLLPYSTLFSALSKFLPQRDMDLLVKSYRDLKGNKITRREMVLCIKRIVGDKLLVAVIKSLQAKKQLTGLSLFR